MSSNGVITSNCGMIIITFFLLLLKRQPDRRWRLCARWKCGIQMRLDLKQWLSITHTQQQQPQQHRVVHVDFNFNSNFDKSEKIQINTLMMMMIWSIWTLFGNFFTIEIKSRIAKWDFLSAVAALLSFCVKCTSVECKMLAILH